MIIYIYTYICVYIYIYTHTHIEFLHQGRNPGYLPDFQLLGVVSGRKKPAGFRVCLGLCSRRYQSFNCNGRANGVEAKEARIK